MTNLTVRIDQRRIYPVSILWALIKVDRKVPVFLDEKLQVIEAFTLFALYSAKEYLKTNTPTASNKGAYNSNINEQAYTLKAFSEFLSKAGPSKKKKCWESVCDEDLEKFKQLQLTSIQGKSNSRSNVTANETVTRKIKIIYNFYYWAQYEQLLIEDRISWDVEAPIRSNLPAYKKHPEKFITKKSLATIYPLREKVTGAKNNQRRQHYATRAELKLLREHFREKCKPLIAERNVLIIDIIEHMGWRGGSIQSLTIEQFSEDSIKNLLSRHKKELAVIPAAQKRGYANSFDVGLQLAIRIQSYIKNIRQKILEKINKTEKEAEGILFISDTKGTPLKAQTISSLIAKGFNAIGVIGERAGAHSIRRKFGKERASEIMEVRKKAGLSMDPQDILFDLADSLGQSSISSTKAYSEGKRDVYSNSIENKQRSEIAELRADLASMELENKLREEYIVSLEKKVEQLKKIPVG